MSLFNQNKIYTTTKDTVESSRNICSLWLILLKSALTVFIWK